MSQEIKNEKTKSIKKPRPHAIVFEDPSLAVHSQAYETDINNMVAGKVPWNLRGKSPFYIDETLLPDNYEELHNLLRDAQAHFMTLPPDIRERFQNNPALLAKALGDPRRQDELMDLGLIEDTRPPKPPAGGAGGRKPPSGQQVEDPSDPTPAEPLSKPAK